MKKENKNDISEILKSGDTARMQNYLGIKNYSNVNDFVKDYVDALNSGDKREIFNTSATSDKLFTKSGKDFEKNGIFYFPNGGKIKQIIQKEDLIRMTLSTVGGFSLNTSLDTNGTPDFALIFSLKGNKKINVENGDVIDFLGYTDDKLVLILKGEPLKVNNLDVNEIHAVKLHKKIKDISIDEPIKKVKPKL